MPTESRHDDAGVLERIVRFSIRHRWLMLVLTLGLVAIGGIWLAVAWRKGRQQR